MGKVGGKVGEMRTTHITAFSDLQFYMVDGGIWNDSVALLIVGVGRVRSVDERHRSIKLCNEGDSLGYLGLQYLGRPEVLKTSKVVN